MVARSEAKLKAVPNREIYSITAQQTEEWKQSAQFLYKQWADDVRKAGSDPDAIMKELQTALVQFNAGF